MTRRTAPATALLATALVAAYGLELAAGGDATCAAWGLTPARATLGTAITSLLLHDPSSLWHLGGNVVFLVAFGVVVERAVGSLRFLALFLAAGLGGAVMHCLIDPSSQTPLVGCSGALFGVLALAGALRPRLLGFVGAFVALNVWNAFTGGGGPVSFGCHIGGFLVGAVVVVSMRLARSPALEVA